MQFHHNYFLVILAKFSLLYERVETQMTNQRQCDQIFPPSSCTETLSMYICTLSFFGEIMVLTVQIKALQNFPLTSQVDSSIGSVVKLKKKQNKMR